ncbi:hypothetical protein PC9H_007353 [Pleurotus ostreatus]|uniref:Uncharacterized protein n=1 Tax=Pleurotus ostreatus TaxID=5322 RepID=A0A8H7DRL5_PLEOS|nr:uncharacterized protein PC9H_007353 [Pleurotus ostreatus]KAF7428134.1 hypothetical protein PC9H_007353 [Pleurotus ostreatus]
MGILALLSPTEPAKQPPTPESQEQAAQVDSEPPSVSQSESPPTPAAQEAVGDEASVTFPPSVNDIPQSPPAASDEKHTDDLTRARVRRFSFKTFSYVDVQPSDEPNGHKPHELSAVKEHEKKQRAGQAFTKRLIKPINATSNRKAKQSALMVRSLIIGPAANAASPKVTKAVAKPQLRKLKSELMRPKSANKVIAQLRALPVMDDVIDKETKKPIGVEDRARGPIHAVCLAHTDAEADAMHFCQLASDAQDEQVAAASFGGITPTSTSMDKLTKMFNNMRLVELIKAPNLGLGEPGDGEGILAGAVPTAETVLDGFKQITPQLMALGFATGRAMLPDHTDVYPPLDRMSVLTYWWGLEVALPPPSLQYLSNAQSISSSLMNFLSAIALINNGVREILPFVRYISQFVDFEFSAIQGQDRGNGVVCAATWIMPAAMVPRPWDFPSPPGEGGPEGDAAKGDFKEPQADNPDLRDLPPLSVPVVIPPLPSLVVTSPTNSSDSQASVSTS